MTRDVEFIKANWDRLAELSAKGHNVWLGNKALSNLAVDTDSVVYAEETASGTGTVLRRVRFFDMRMSWEGFFDKISVYHNGMRIAWYRDQDGNRGTMHGYVSEIYAYAEACSKKLIELESKGYRLEFHGDTLTKLTVADDKLSACYNASDYTVVCCFEHFGTRVSAHRFFNMIRAYAPAQPVDWLGTLSESLRWTKGLKENKNE